jgi:hypothetical protein
MFIVRNSKYIEKGNVSIYSKYIETLPFSIYLEFRTMNKANKPSDSERYTPSSEPFRFYSLIKPLKPDL